MIPYLDAFVPAFGLLALGAALKRALLPADAVWAGIERLVFYALMPALLASSIAQVDLGALPFGRMAGTIWAGLGLGTLVCAGLARLWRLPAESMTSVVQGGIRFNNLMGFALVGALFGPGGTALGAVATGLIVPFVQAVTALAFALGGVGGRRVAAWPVARQVLLNPLMLGVLVGFVVAGLGGMPPGFGPLARTLGQASIALGLLCVGAALSPGAMTGRIGVQLVTTAVKLGLVPLLTLCLGHLLGLEPLPLACAVVFMALPTATTSYVMARAMGGDAPLMAAITTLEHLVAVLTLPLWIALLAPIPR